MRWKVACFDWNGTALDDRNLAYEFVAHIFRSYRRTVPSPATYYREVSEAGYMEFYHKYGIPLGEGSKSRLNQTRREYFAAHPDLAHLAPYLRVTLAACRSRGLKTALVSAESRPILMDRMVQFSLAELFDQIRGDVQDKAETLLEVARRFDAEPQETFYVDDSFEGLLAAKSAGVVPVGYTGGYGSPKQIAEAQPDKKLVIGDFLDVIRILDDA